MNGVVYLLLFMCIIIFSCTHNAYAESSEVDDGINILSETPDSSNLSAQSEDIVVTAERWGEAKVAAESEYEEAEITSHGVDRIEELLERLRPYIDPTGGDFVILINGKPAGFDRSVLAYPTEALQRIAVLKTEAATQYGEAGSKRVVNLVLKKHFTMVSAGSGIKFATAGGQYGSIMSADLTQISGHTRLSVQAGVGADSAFPKTARKLPPREGPFDSVGFISAPDGSEVDPALSLALGQVVSVAAIPKSALSGVPTLDSFFETANVVHAVDPNRFETLQSSRRNKSFGIGIIRPIGSFSASLTLNGSASSSEGQRGLPMVSLLIPSGHPISPFSNDVLLIRPFAGERALRMENASTSVTSSLTINGNIGEWQTNFGASYSRNSGNNYIENGVDIARAQLLLDTADSGFNPFGLWDDGLLIASDNRTKSDNLSFRLNVRKTIINLPAGPLSWNLSGNTSRNSSHSRVYDALGNLILENEIARSQSNGQMSLSVPITRRVDTGPEWLGDLTLDLSASAQTMKNTRVQKRYGVNINWLPWSIIQFRGSMDYMEAAPSFDQLDAPVITTVNRIYDYEREEVAEPIWMVGGNPNLKRGIRQSLSLAATVRPLDDQVLTLNIDYQRSVAKSGTIAFPELTPVIEAAFPERVIRGADGRLVTIDARAINIDHDTDIALTSSVALRLPRRRSLKPKDRNLAVQSTADPLQFSVSLNHRWRLKSQLLIRSGVPVIDQLRDSGQSRHSLSLQATVGKRGIGANLSGNWSNSARLRRNTTDTDAFFIFKPPLTINVSTFVEPDRLFDLPKAKGVLNGLKVSIDIQNLFNGYRRVTLDDGRIPSGYSRDEVDPLGRIVRLSLRKKF